MSDVGSRETKTHETFDGTTGTTTTSSGTVASNSDGDTTYVGANTTNSGPDGTTEAYGEVTLNEDGSVRTTSMGGSQTDKDGNVTFAANEQTDENGTKTTAIKDSNGNVTTTVVDKNGKVVSVTTVDADGNEIETPEDSKTDFWDADIIYGDHKDVHPDAGDFTNWGKTAHGLFDAEALSKVLSKEAADIIVDQFGLMK